MLKNSIVAVTIIALLIGIYFAHKSGYEKGQAELIADHNEELVRLQQENAHKLQEKQNEILEVENAWLETDRSTRVVYRDRVRKVVETVTKYVNHNNLNQCRIDDDSVHQINQALRGESEGNDSK